MDVIADLGEEDFSSLRITKVNLLPVHYIAEWVSIKISASQIDDDAHVVEHDVLNRCSTACRLTIESKHSHFSILQLALVENGNRDRLTRHGSYTCVIQVSIS